MKPSLPISFIVIGFMLLIMTYCGEQRPAVAKDNAYNAGLERAYELPKLQAHQAANPNLVLESD